jgi:hypothetical protein
MTRTLLSRLQEEQQMACIGTDADPFAAWVLRLVAGRWGEVASPAERSLRSLQSKKARRRESVVMASVEQTAFASIDRETTGTGPSKRGGQDLSLTAERDYLDWLENHRPLAGNHGLGRRLATFGGLLAAIMSVLSALKVR